MKSPHPKRDKIIELLLERVPPKVIASDEDVPLSTIYSMITRYFTSTLKLKKELPDPRQLRLF